MNSENKYILKVGDEVKINWVKTERSKTYFGKIGEVISINKSTLMAEVEFEEALPPHFKRIVPFYLDELMFISRPESPKPCLDEEAEPMELDHLCMPTTQDEIEPIDKSEVLEEISNFINQMKTKGWIVDSLNIDLCHQNNKDFVVVQF